jgi:hypothetical protein
VGGKLATGHAVVSQSNKICLSCWYLFLPKNINIYLSHSLNKIKIPTIAVAKRRKTAVENHVFQSIRTEEYGFVGVKDILFFLSSMEKSLVLNNMIL